MVFSSLVFVFFFLPVTLGLYYLVPFRAKNAVLLLCSLVFYAWGEPVYVVLMILNIAFNYLIGMDIAAGESQGRRKAALFCGLFFNIALLGFFKYAGFVAENLNAVLGTDLAFHPVGLPVGISFYTFQVMSYIIDVYKGKILPQKNPLTLGVYVTMFPQLIAGPIVQYADIEQQLARRVISMEGFGRGAERFIVGLGKKVLLANSAGALFDTLSAGGGDMSVLTGWIAAAAFTFQIYFDFSGYSDMAIGLGKMLGFDFRENFDYPYMSKSVTEFWRRWHISLGSWFRDYVCIPLGGSYTSPARHIRNIMAVWMLTGLWHGASWNFVLWGLYYGVLLIFEKYVLLRLTGEDPRGAAAVFMHLYTMVCVIFGWVLFSAPDLSHALHLISVMLGFGASCAADSTGLYYLAANAVPGFLMLVGSTTLGKRACGRLAAAWPRAWGVLSPVLSAAVLVVSAAYLVNETYNPFLYFRF